MNNYNENNKIKDNYIEISGIFLENGILNIVYELEVKENKNHKNKNKNKEKTNKEIEEKIKEENKILKENIIQNKKYNLEKTNLINYFFNLNNNNKPKIEDIEKLEKHFTTNELNDYIKIRKILNIEIEENLEAIEKRRLRRWSKHRIKSIYKEVISREMTKLNLNNRIIKKERFNNNKLEKKKKSTKITEFTTLFKIDNYEKTNKYKYKNNPVYLNIVAFNNLANYLYRINLKGKKARIQGKLINYYNNDNKYIGNYVEIKRIKIYKSFSKDYSTIKN